MPRAREPCCPWSDGLPPELLDIILRYVTCPADRVYFAAVCRAWRSSAQVHKAPPCQLPWLLLPSPIAPSFLSLHSGATRRLYLPESIRAARLCGSHEGGWVALAFNQWQGYAAVNLCSGAMVPLPDRLRTTHRSAHRWINTACEHQMVIRTITFSGTPSTEGCLAAAHVSSASNIAFCRTGMDRHWITCGRNVDVIEDIIYYKEGFHVLSNTEDVVVYTARWHGPLLMSCTSYLVQKRSDYKPDSLRPKSHSMSRYLVESRGKLLMILRLFRPKRRREFRIFEMNLAGGGSQASWVELHELPGRVLLLGRGCSRAFEVSQFDTLPVGNIYYLDDTSFNLSLALSSGGSSHSSIDMGEDNFHNKMRNHSRCIPRQFTSDCSSLPIWLIP